MTNNNRRKMKRKKAQQPEVFWNLNHKPRRTQAPQKIVFVQLISKQNIRNKKIQKQYDLNLTSGLFNFIPTNDKVAWNPKIKNSKKMPVNGTGLFNFVPTNDKVAWNPKIKNPKKMPVNGQGFIFKGLSSMPQNLSGFEYKKTKNNMGSLYNSVPKKTKIEPMQLFTPIKMEPASFIKKEHLYQKELSPWGDVDMDGTLNHMDCNPREISQDGILGDIAGKIGGAIKSVARKITGRSDDREGEERVALATAQDITGKDLSEEKFERSYQKVKEKSEMKKEKLLAKEEEEERQKGLKKEGKDIEKEIEYEEKYPAIDKKDYKGDYKKDIKELKKYEQEKKQYESAERLGKEDKEERWAFADLAVEKERKRAQDKGIKLSDEDVEVIKAEARSIKGEEQSKRDLIVTRSGYLFLGKGKGEIRRPIKITDNPLGLKTLNALADIVHIKSKQAGEKLGRIGTKIVTDAGVAVGSLDMQKRSVLAKDLAKSKQAAERAKELLPQRDMAQKIHSRQTKQLRNIESKIEKAIKKGEPTGRLEMQRRGIAKAESQSSKRLSRLDVQFKTLQRKGETAPKIVKQQEKLKVKMHSDRAKFGAGILSAVTPLGEVPEIKKMATKDVSEKTGKGKKGRGRPKGSFKGGYSVDGETISEAQFQQFRSAENKRRKAMGIQKIPTGARQFNQSKQAVQRVETPQAVEEYEGEEIPQEYRMQEGRAVLQPQPQPQQQRRPQTIQEKQQAEQQSDNILHAPSIMKGELTNTGGILTPVGPSILDAPNIFKGGLRNVDQEEEVPSVTLGERPNSNPYGTEYTEIEPGTGKVIVKQRIQEKWVTGEAI